MEKAKTHSLVTDLPKPCHQLSHYSMPDPIHPETGLPRSASLEALLFVASGPVTLLQLASTLQINTGEVEAGLVELEVRLSHSGLRIQHHAGRLQLTTAPEAAGVVERFLGLEAASRLSRAALETLAIIAYQQPVTRPEIDAVRGVNSDGVLKSLLGKGLVQESGRAAKPGRPILYATTPDFLSHFGLNKINELPPLDDQAPGPSGT